ncbi:MAG: ATP-dependent DNA helicase RecG, partial [Caulobacterales bacterium]
MRPESLFPLFADLTSLPGVGPKLAGLLEKAFGGGRVKDALFTLPTGLVDRSRRVTVSECGAGGSSGLVTLEVEIEAHIAPPTFRQPYKIRASDETGFLHLVFFNARKDYLMRALPPGERRIVSGKAERFGSEIQIVHPDLVAKPGEILAEDLIQPVYPLTAGLSANVARKTVRAALERLPDLPEWIDPSLPELAAWPVWAEAMRTVHAPQGARAMEPSDPARTRLAFDELLAHQLALKLARASRKARRGRELKGSGDKVKAVLAAAPFTPTGAQMRAFEAAKADMETATRMMRLVHGDVGSGKTFVAALCAAQAAEAGVLRQSLSDVWILQFQ